MTSGCGTITLPRINVWVGPPPTIEDVIVTPSNPCTGSWVTLNVDPINYNCTYIWDDDHDYDYDDNAAYVQFYQPANNTSAYITVQGVNSCGTSNLKTKFFTFTYY